MKRSVLATVVGVVAVVVIAGAVVLRIQRAREWAHGGDRLTVEVEVALAGGDTFENEVVRLGVPPGTGTRFIDADQSIVVRVRWSGLTAADGWFQLIALDKRVVPSRPLAADGGWNSDGLTGSNWAGAYEALAENYEWLRGVSEANYRDAAGLTNFPTAAVDARAIEAGTLTAWFRQWGDGRIPFADQNREILLALVYVDASGDVRWAKRIFG